MTFAGTWQGVGGHTDILRCICHFPFVFTLRRIFRCLQVIVLPTPENVKRHTTGQQRPIFSCSLQLRLTVDRGTPRHRARSSTVHCQSELLGTVENTVFAGRWCGICSRQTHRHIHIVTYGLNRLRDRFSGHVLPRGSVFHQAKLLVCFMGAQLANRCPHTNSDPPPHINYLAWTSSRLGCWLDSCLYICNCSNHHCWSFNQSPNKDIKERTAIYSIYSICIC